MTPTAETETPLFVLETGKRLSHSFLWNLQRTFYAKHGIFAWKQGAVPQYVTTNPFIARAYARVALAYLRDCHAAGQIDESQPFYIIEAASGSGRFGFHFLTTLRRMHERSALRHIRLKFVMTDFSEWSLQYFRSHFRLKALMDEGWLDLAPFDVERDRELKLEQSGEVISAATLRNPAIVIANYLFDTLPQDVFWIDGEGVLHESLITLRSGQEELDRNDPELLRRLKIDYERRPAGADYYSDAAWDAILEEYRTRVKNGCLVFPCGSLKCLENFAELTGGRMLLLTADKGDHHPLSAFYRSEPNLTVHGSFSVLVNYHVMGQYLVQRGGEAHYTDHTHRAIDISAFTLSPAAKFPETGLAFEEEIAGFGPDDFFCGKTALDKAENPFTLQEFLVFLRLSNYDATILAAYIMRLMPQVVEAPANLKQDLHGAMQKVWEMYYPIGDQPDVPFCLGMVYTGLERCEEALEFFKHSISLYGPSAPAAYHTGVCHLALGDVEAAIKNVDWALELNPTLESALRLKAQLVD